MIEKAKIKIRTTRLDGEINNKYWETPLIVESGAHGQNDEVDISLPGGAGKATVLAIDLVNAVIGASILDNFKEKK